MQVHLVHCYKVAILFEKKYKASRVICEVSIEALSMKVKSTCMRCDASIIEAPERV